MFRMDDELNVDVHRDAVNFRKSDNGLAAIVERLMRRDPFSRAVAGFEGKALPPDIWWKAVR